MASDREQMKKNEGFISIGHGPVSQLCLNLEEKQLKHQMLLA